MSLIFKFQHQDICVQHRFIHQWQENLVILQTITEHTQTKLHRLYILCALSSQTLFTTRSRVCQLHITHYTLHTRRVGYLCEHDSPPHSSTQPWITPTSTSLALRQIVDCPLWKGARGPSSTPVTSPAPTRTRQTPLLRWVRGMVGTMACGHSLAWVRTPEPWAREARAAWYPAHVTTITRRQCSEVSTVHIYLSRFDDKTHWEVFTLN